MSKDEIFKVILENADEVLGDVEFDEVTMEQSLKDLGANSIDRVEIVTMVAEQLNVELLPQELGKVSNISSLVELIASKF
ncbi:phosphopantetheine-binding protein [Cellulosilyticum ruminicola]|uniref:phosphopantetheine-binding protein n=1 Tax=Cellulosilyticum ruminicola TaxID=425254 RepID=UPI0006D128D8|nr:phosphopantetheine-binding protein [Cellulosilyticum ruminicola]